MHRQRGIKLLVHFCRADPGHSSRAAKFTGDGDIDPAFGTSGRLDVEMCSRIAATADGRLAVWQKSSASLFDGAGLRLGEVDGAGGTTTTDGTKLLVARFSADGSGVIREFEWAANSGVTAQLRETQVSKIGSVIAQNGDGYVSSANVLNDKRVPTATIIAYDAQGTERFRIASDNPIVDEKNGHCSVNALLLFGGELVTLDINCQRLRKYSAADGSYLASISQGDLKFSAIATDGTSLLAVSVAKDGSQFIQHLK